MYIFLEIQRRYILKNYIYLQRKEFMKFYELNRDKEVSWEINGYSQLDECQFLQILVRRSPGDGVLWADLRSYESIQRLYEFKQCGTPTHTESSYKFEQITSIPQLFWGFRVDLQMHISNLQILLHLIGFFMLCNELI